VEQSLTPISLKDVGEVVLRGLGHVGSVSFPDVVPFFQLICCGFIKKLKLIYGLGWRNTTKGK